MSGALLFLRRAAVLLPLLAVLPARADAPSTAMDVAPTLLQLKPGAAGLFYVTNHGAAPVAVEIAPMDWRQQDGRDALTPSHELFASPPVVTIAPGVRQSVRLLAAGGGQGAHSYRLLVSELPDPNADPNSVKVLLQFSVPVFVGDGGKPALAWKTQAGVLTATNTSAAPVKLNAPLLDGALLAPGPIYLLPGTQRSFALPAAVQPRLVRHVTARDALSGRDLDADTAP